VASFVWDYAFSWRKELGVDSTTLEHEPIEAGAELPTEPRSLAARILTSPILWLAVSLLVLGAIAFWVISAGAASAAGDCGGG